MMKDLFASCKQKQELLKALFLSCATAEEKYQKIIELGRLQPPLSPQFKIPENLVKGCQSTMYLYVKQENGLIIFHAESDALISAGLAVLLTQVYSGEPPEVILTFPPTYLEEIGIASSLTPSRANGLYSIHLRMKQEALHILHEKSTT